MMGGCSSFTLATPVMGWLSAIEMLCRALFRAEWSELHVHVVLSDTELCSTSGYAFDGHGQGSGMEYTVIELPRICEVSGGWRP